MRYAKSNYASNRWSSDEAYLADESTVIHSGDAVDLGQELVTVTVWNNDNAHKSMACLAVNTNGDRLTEDFTITETTDKVYTVSSNFTLVEESDVELTIDIVYTPYFDLLFFPSFYINTLYSDKGSACLPRVTKRPANMYFDETNMTVKSNVENGTITFYLDDFENLNKYTIAVIDVIKRYTTTIPWDEVNLADTFLFNTLLPCFDENQYNAVLNNLVSSGNNVNVVTSKDEINNSRSDLYAFYIKHNTDNKFIYENDGLLSMSQSRSLALPNFVQYLIMDSQNNLLITMTEDIGAQGAKLQTVLTKLLATMCFTSGLRTTKNDVEFTTSTCFIGKALKCTTDEYNFINDYYLPKVALSPKFARNIQTSQSIYDSEIVNNHIELDSTVDVDKTETSNYYIAVDSANYIVDGNTIPNQGYALPVATLPFYPFFEPTLL